MNTKQLSTALYVTSPYWLTKHLGHDWTHLTFEKTVDNENYVLLFGDNLCQKSVFDKLRCVTLSIGIRGGVKIVRKHSS